MTAIFASSALLAGAWADDVRLTIADGVVSAVETASSPQAGDERVDVLVPAMANVHSHAFQRAMAGLAERRGPDSDNFWSWRETMYRFALSMNADQFEAVAAQLYVEMLEAGFGRVGEFHYLHHQEDGRPYDDVAELARRIVAASEATGIGLTLLPVFYAHATFGGAPPSEGQRRFINSVDGFGRIVEACRSALRDVPGAVLGIAPHSLRAVTPDELAAILPLADGGPVHIHVAEQVKEVDDCLAWSGARPVEWLLGNAPVDGRWCLIHTTHTTPAETQAFARSGAVAGLCPITEANLGDGIFSGAFVEQGGAFGIGSDSNVMISVAGELRQFEYAQRLGRRARNVIAAPWASTGETLFASAVAGGAKAMGVPGGIAQGEPADLVALDVSAVPYLPRESLIDHWIFAGGVGVDRVWRQGRRLVEGGRHIARDGIEARFRAAMAELRAAG